MADTSVNHAAAAVEGSPALEPMADDVPPEVRQLWHRHHQTIVVLQGSGALGAYQAGVYAGLEHAGMVVNWLAGVSIGGVNAALIAGNPPGRRVARLREFWDRASARHPGEQFRLPDCTDCSWNEQPEPGPDRSAGE